MSQTVYIEYFDIVIENLILCKYCHKELENNELDICLGCELSLELTESLIALAEAY